MPINITVELVIKTCSCGGVFAVPNWCQNNVACPMCAQRTIARKQERLDENTMEFARLGRVISSLRGVVKRQKARRS